MTMPNDPDDVTDDRLRNAFRAAGESASPDLTPRVKYLIRRQRARTRLGIGVAAATLVAAGGVAWQSVAANDRTTVGRSSRSSPIDPTRRSRPDCSPVRRSIRSAR